MEKELAALRASHKFQDTQSVSCTCLIIVVLRCVFSLCAMKHYCCGRRSDSYKEAHDAHDAPSVGDITQPVA